jgi:endonuclease/exonuclease/phosphatase (EEP) superfamily protein YafD
MNQTIRFALGLFFLIISVIMFFVIKNSFLIIGISSILPALLIIEALTYCGLTLKPASIINSEAKFTIYCQNVKCDSPSGDEIMDRISQLAPEVVVLQEMTSQRLKTISPMLQEMGYCYSVEALSAWNYSLSLLIFSRLPLKNGTTVFTKGPFWSLKWPLQYCEFQFKGEWIRLLNVHLIPPHKPDTDFIPTPSQQKLVPRQLNAVLSLSSNDMPAIICGDFNQTPTSKYLCPLKKSWIDAFRESGKGWGCTWSTKLPLFRIDYIYHTQSLKSISCCTIKNHFSDHRGILATFALVKSNKTKQKTII